MWRKPRNMPVLWSIFLSPQLRTAGSFRFSCHQCLAVHLSVLHSVLPGALVTHLTHNLLVLSQNFCLITVLRLVIQFPGDMYFFSVIEVQNSTTIPKFSFLLESSGRNLLYQFPFHVSVSVYRSHWKFLFNNYRAY